MYLGIDLGTSGVKALLVDGDQRIIATNAAPLEASRPRPGWSEQDPSGWIAATELALDALSVSHPKELAAVRGIGLSGQMHGATLLDAADKVLRPCILWNDTRSDKEAAELDADPNFRRLTGNIVFPGFTAPKLVWIARHQPELFARIAKVLLPKDYVRLWLTGEHATEMSDAAGTSWLETGARCWSTSLLAGTGMAKAQMPRLCEGTEVSGGLRSELAERWGMRTETPVAGGAGDNAASAVGIGAIQEGHAFLSIGTSGVLLAANDGYRPRPDSAIHTFCHALPNAWHQMGVILSATDSLSWLTTITGRRATDLTGALGPALSSPSPVLFLPYLSGERTPHNDTAIRGTLAGVGHETGPEALTQAVVEGVAFAFRDCHSALEAAGTQLERVTAIGGGSRSSYWMKVIATTLGIGIDIPADGGFGAAFGAARLGLIAAEDADPTDVCTPPRIQHTIEPDAVLQEAYQDAYQRYRALYLAIKKAMT